MHISAVTSAHAGEYTVTVRNNVNAITSNPAQLTVTAKSFSLSSPRIVEGNFSFSAAVSGSGPFIVWATADLASWIPVATNSPSVGEVQFSEPVSSVKRFYLLSTAP